MLIAKHNGRAVRLLPQRILPIFEIQEFRKLTHHDLLMSISEPSTIITRRTAEYIGKLRFPTQKYTIFLFCSQKIWGAIAWVTK